MLAAGRRGFVDLPYLIYHSREAIPLVKPSFPFPKGGLIKGELPCHIAKACACISFHYLGFLFVFYIIDERTRTHCWNKIFKIDKILLSLDNNNL